MWIMDSSLADANFGSLHTTHIGLYREIIKSKKHLIGRGGGGGSEVSMAHEKIDK